MSIRASIINFFTKPPAPSELHRVGVAVLAIGVAGYAARRRVVSPAAAAIAGAATVAVGHAVAPSWAIKSAGLGLLAGAAASEVYGRYESPTTAPAISPPVLPTNGVQATPSATPEVMSETQFLIAIEDRVIPAETFVTPSGSPRPSGSSARTPAELPRFVQLSDGTLLSPAAYAARFPQKVAEADARGRAKRSVRSSPDLPAQTEREYLEWVRDFCLCTSHPNGSRIASNPAAQGEQAMRMARDIVLLNGEFRSTAAFVREFGEAINAAYDQCATMLRNAEANGQLADVTPTETVTPVVEMSDVRVFEPRDQMGSNAVIGSLTQKPLTQAQKGNVDPGALMQQPSFKSSRTAQQAQSVTGARATPVGGERFVVTSSEAQPVQRIAKPSGSPRGKSPRSR